MLVVIEPPTAIVGDGPGGSITGVKRPADVMGAVGESKFLIHALYLYVCMYVCMYVCIRVKVNILLVILGVRVAGQCSDEVRLAVEKCRQILVHTLG